VSQAAASGGSRPPSKVLLTRTTRPSGSSTNGWECLVNFGDRPRDLPPGEVVLASEPLDPDARTVPPDAAVWIKNA
jgi:Domain of unknown function (DUF3459)